MLVCDGLQHQLPATRQLIHRTFHRSHERCERHWFDAVIRLTEYPQCCQNACQLLQFRLHPVHGIDKIIVLAL